MFLQNDFEAIAILNFSTSLPSLDSTLWWTVTRIIYKTNRRVSQGQGGHSLINGSNLLSYEAPPLTRHHCQPRHCCWIPTDQQNICWCGCVGFDWLCWSFEAEPPMTLFAMQWSAHRYMWQSRSRWIFKNCETIFRSLIIP